MSNVTGLVGMTSVADDLMATQAGVSVSEETLKHRPDLIVGELLL
jgi:hypothetical protein